jgi:hypothetical protein
MPTPRPRLTVTETDELGEALDAAAAHWPAEAIARTSGSLTGAFEPGYLERLREDWEA